MEMNVRRNRMKLEIIDKEGVQRAVIEDSGRKQRKESHGDRI